MISLKTVLPILFLLAGFFATWGSNKLNKLVHELYPEEKYFSLKPPTRILKLIEVEHKDDKESIGRLNEARRLVNVGRFIFAVFILTFFYVLS